MLPPLATLDQLAAWTGRDVSELPANAGAVLATTSAIVRGEAKQRFTRSTTTALLYPVRGWVTLPQRPVLSVGAVWCAARVIEPGAWTLRRDRLHIPGATGPVEVTYTHGYAETPPDVLGIVLTAAARVITNPNDLRQESVGSVSVTYAAETIGVSLAPADRDLLARYRRRAAVVTLE